MNFILFNLMQSWIVYLNCNTFACYLLSQYLSFPVLHKVGNIGIFVISNGNKFETVKNQICFNANLHLTWDFEFKLK